MFLRRNLPGLLWAGFIFFLSVVPTSQVPNKYAFEGADKLVHIFLYSIQSLLLIVGFTRQITFSRLRDSPILYAVVFATTYGILIEFLQGTVFVSRSTEVLDMLANMAGTLLGVLFFRLIYGNQKT